MSGRVVGFSWVVPGAGEMYAVVTRRYGDRTEQRREPVPDPETGRRWLAEMKAPRGERPGGAESAESKEGEMKERTKAYTKLGCWSADGAILPTTGMDFRVGETEARAIVRAARLAADVPEGSYVVLRHLLEAATSVFQEAGSNRGPADVEVGREHFTVRAGKLGCGRQRVSALASFFGIPWDESDGDWWAKHLPPGWRLGNHQGRETAQLRDPGGRPVAADGMLLGQLAAHLGRGGAEEAA